MLRDSLSNDGLAQPYTLLRDARVLDQHLLREIENGDARVVAAGGDGTVNLVLNRIMKLEESLRNHVTLGALGIGSSNDFHKEVNRQMRRVGDIPVRLDWMQSEPHNVGQVDFLDSKDRWHRRYFVINCSIGVLAGGNLIFNTDRGLVRWLKPRWLNGSIAAAGIKAMLTLPNMETSLVLDGHETRASVTSLSIVINPHLSGSLTLDIPASPTADNFGVALCEDLNLIGRLRIFAALSKGQFSSRPGTRVWQSKEVEIRPTAFVPLELDGEVFTARAVMIKLLKGAVNVCCR
jgi:diacylglycerol kinase family enzyme